MVFNEKDIKLRDALSLIVEGIQLNEIINKEFMNFLQDRYGDSFEINVSDIMIRILPKELGDKQDKSIGENVGITPFIKLIHTGPDDFNNRITILSSSNYDLIKRFTKK